MHLTLNFFAFRRTDLPHTDRMRVEVASGAVYLFHDGLSHNIAEQTGEGVLAKVRFGVDQQTQSALHVPSDDFMKQLS